MHDFVAVHAEEGCPQDALRVCVGQHLHESLLLAGFAGAADALHRHLCAQHPHATGQGFSLRHADAAQRRVDEQRTARDAIGDAARVGIEQIRHLDLVVVPRGVREGAAAVAVAHGPDALRAGAALIVDLDVAARVGADAGEVEPQSVGVGLASDGQQHMAAGDAFATAGCGADHDAVAPGCDSAARAQVPACRRLDGPLNSYRFATARLPARTITLASQSRAWSELDLDQVRRTPPH